MSKSEFMESIDQDAVVRAIQQAEGRTSAEIRVFVSHKKPRDAVAAAQGEFVRLGMTATQLRNGVLIYLAPKVRKFAIIGDQGIHQRVGDAYWRQTVAEMTCHFGRGDFTAGIVYAIGVAGASLAEHFPRRSDDANELPDQIAHD